VNVEWPVYKLVAIWVGVVLFADDLEVLCFGVRAQEDCCVVTEDSNHDHDDEDGQEDPVAQGGVQEEGLR
jgi:hypothetical protein